jgi:hypothetical protein
MSNYEVDESLDF